MGNREDHLEQAQILRKILEAFPPDDDKPADRAIRRMVEGAVIASELESEDSTRS